MLGHLTETQIQEFLQGDSLGGLSSTVDACYLAGLRLVEEEEGVAAHARLHRREDGHRGGHGDARVGGRAPCVEYPEADQGGAWMFAGDGPLRPEDRRAPTKVRAARPVVPGEVSLAAEHAIPFRQDATNL